MGALVALMIASIALPGSSIGVRAAVCRTASVNDASATGHATSLIVRNPLLTIPLPNPTVATTQKGPGTQTQSDNLQSIVFPPDGSVVRAGLMEVHSTSAVNATTIRADQDNQATLANVVLLGGAVKATLVGAHGHVTATDQMADLTGAGSTIKDLTINGAAVSRVYPNLKVPLPAQQFGDGSYVMVYERKDVGMFPDQAHGFYVADLTIRMLHAYVRDSDPTTPGDQNLEIIVAETQSHAEAPTAYCGGLQMAGANAVVARVEPNGPASAVVVGGVTVPQTGGLSTQSYNDIALGDNGDTVHSSAASSKAQSRVYVGSWDTSVAIASLSDVCLMQSNGDCLVTAQLIRAESDSVADWHKADSWGGSSIAHLVIAGTDVCSTLALQDTCQPPPNTKMTIGPYTVFLNERSYDAKAETCIGHTGFTVRAVRIVGPTVGQVILAQAHSDATFC